MKIKDLTDWIIMPQSIKPMGLIHKPGQGPNDRFDYKNKGNNRANETLEDKFQSALNAEPVQPKREWTAFEMACMEGGHPLPEDNSDEAWELLGQKDPAIKKYVTDLGLKYDQDSVNKVVPMIDKARETTITPSQIPQLKNLANKPADPQALKNILKIKGTPDAPEKFAQIMQARDRAEGRSRNYDVADLVNAINTNNYDPPVILKIGTQNFVVGGRTRLYAALALNKPIKVKVLEDTVNEKCWDGYKQAGMKNKGGRQVPNCVPEDAAGVGIITKQNTTGDVKPGDEYKNVKKLHLEFKQFIAEAQQYKGAIFLNDRTAIVGQAHNQTPELSPETLKRVQDIAIKYGAYSEGNGADEPYTKAIGITNYRGSWDDLFAGSISGYPWQFIYSIMANVNDNRTWDQIGEDPNKTVFNQILASQQNHNFFPGKRYDGQTLLKFLEAISEGNNNFVEMAKLPATKKNVYDFLKKGESLMFPSNWQSYPYKAGRVAKAANDARDKFLAKRTQGAYFVGDGHLLNIQTLANKKIEENFADGRVKGKSRPGRVKRAGASCKGSVTDLRKKAKNAGGEKAKMYHWCANMKSGRSKK